MQTLREAGHHVNDLILSSVHREKHSFFITYASQRGDNDNTTTTMHLAAGHLTFALVLVPGVDAVLHTVAHQSVVDAHVAVTEECVCVTRSWGGTAQISLMLSMTFTLSK